MDKVLIPKGFILAQGIRSREDRFDSCKKGRAGRIPARGGQSLAMSVLAAATAVVPTTTSAEVATAAGRGAVVRSGCALSVAEVAGRS